MLLFCIQFLLLEIIYIFFVVLNSFNYLVLLFISNILIYKNKSNIEHFLFLYIIYFFYLYIVYIYFLTIFLYSVYLFLNGNFLKCIEQLLNIIIYIVIFFFLGNIWFLSYINILFFLRFLVYKINSSSTVSTSWYEYINNCINTLFLPSIEICLSSVMNKKEYNSESLIHYSTTFFSVLCYIWYLLFIFKFFFFSYKILFFFTVLFKKIVLVSKVLLFILLNNKLLIIFFLLEIFIYYYLTKNNNK